MFGIPIDGPAEVFCDNQSLFKNLIIPTFTIFNHRFREAQVDDIIWVGQIEGIKKLSGLFTKTICFIPTIQGIILKIFNNSAAVVTLDGG